MKRLILPVLSVFLMGAATAATDADSAAMPDAGQVTESVPVKGSSPYKLHPTEYNDYLYQYILNTDQVVWFTRRVNRYFINMKDERWVEIYATAPGKFATNEGALIEFSDNGDRLVITDPQKIGHTGAHLLAARGQ